jgi:hypothetical protein
MARLIITTPGLEYSSLELRLGVNRVGRAPQNDFSLNHASVSNQHCELVLSAEGVALHDCNSTNGTFINDEPVTEAWLEPGQRLRLGDVELTVESTDAHIAIPHIERAQPAAPPPVVLDSGAMLCARHPEQPALFQCTVCKEIMCGGCVRVIRMKGGKPHYLCVICHNPCERLGGEVTKKQKKGMFAFLEKTVLMKIIHLGDKK